MMTNQTALKKLKEIPFDDKELKATLEDALKARIPTAAQSINEEDFGGHSAICPRCFNVVVKIDDLGDVCCHCGQELNWDTAELKGAEENEPLTRYIKCPFDIGPHVYTVIEDEVTKTAFISEETVTDISARGVWISGFDPPENDCAFLVEWEEFGFSYFRTFYEANAALESRENSEAESDLKEGE